MTQTIDIDGHAVHASALLCRQPDGSWRIAPQDARGAPPTRLAFPLRVAPRSPESSDEKGARSELMIAKKFPGAAPFREGALTRYGGPSAPPKRVASRTGETRFFPHRITEVTRRF
jgi:hypothetical protein